MGEREELFTSAEAAEKLGVKQGSIRQYIKRGWLKAIKRGPMNFISDSEIEQYRREHPSKSHKEK